MSGDIAPQGFRQAYADFKRKDTVQMIPIVIMTIEDGSDREYITGLFLKNERGMYAMALKIVKEHHTACDMVSESCLKMIEKIGYLREISMQKQTPYIASTTSARWRTPDRSKMDRSPMNGQKSPIEERNYLKWSCPEFQAG